MVKGTKLSEFEKGEVTALKRAGKSQREISKALGYSKTIICNEKIKKGMEQDQKNYHHNSRDRWIVREVKRKLRQNQKYCNFQWMLVLEQLKGI